MLKVYGILHDGMGLYLCGNFLNDTFFQRNDVRPHKNSKKTGIYFAFFYLRINKNVNAPLSLLLTY